MFLRLLNLHLSLPTLQGGDTTAVLAAGIPNINGNVWAYARKNMAESTGAFIKSTNGGIYAYSNPSPSTDLVDRNITFDASESNSIYGASQTVQPPALSLIPQIKF